MWKERRYAEVNEDRVRGEEVSVGGEEELEEEKEGGWKWTWAWTLREGVLVVWVERWVMNDVFFCFFFLWRCLLNFSGPADSLSCVLLSQRWNGNGVFVESLFCWIKFMSSSYRRKLSLRWGDEVFLLLVVMIIIKKKVSHGTITNQKTQHDLFSRSIYKACLLGKRWVNRHTVIDLLDWNKGCFFLFRKNGIRQLKSAPQPFLFARVSPAIFPTRIRQWYLNGLM